MKLKYKLTILALFLFLRLAVYAQQISLQVTLSTLQNNSLAGATLQLYSLPDTILLNAQVAETNGNIFLVKPFARYLLKAVASGYEATETSIAVKDQPVQLHLFFKKKLTSLKGVEVTARKQLLKQEDDKTIVDATVLANSSSNAYEVLEKTPGAVIDQDGNVYLSSTTPATIFINGREMKLSSADIASLLKSLPAGSVSKIEILRSPSAKYDAASSWRYCKYCIKERHKNRQQWQCKCSIFSGCVQHTNRRDKHQ